MGELQQRLPEGYCIPEGIIPDQLVICLGVDLNCAPLRK